MQVKINFGYLKRRTLFIGKNSKMRPTQSKTKSTIFNMIEISNKSNVLDLFAGTGALGFESLSLGAQSVIWVDNNVESAKAIKNNIVKFNLVQEMYKIYKTDFRLALKKLDKKIDIIFLDPPFIALEYWDIALEIINNLNILSENGIIILECPHNSKIKNLDLFITKKNRRVGKKDIIILSKK